MPKFIFEFPTPPNYSLFSTCHSHGWINLPPFHYNVESDELHFGVNFMGNSHDVSVVQRDKKAFATINSEISLTDDLKNGIRDCVVRVLDLNTNTDDLLKKAQKIGPEYVDLVMSGAGRLLRSATLWEDAAKTLFTTNCSWAMTRSMCQAACSNAFVQSTPSGVFPFPNAQAFLKFSEQQIRSLIPIGYRAKYFLSLARLFSSNSFLNTMEVNRFPFDHAYNLVRAIDGFGDYATSHLLVMMGYLERIPVDSVVVAFLRRNYKFRKTQAFIDRHYRKWGAYKWWGLKLEKMLKGQNWLGD